MKITRHGLVCFISIALLSAAAHGAEIYSAYYTPDAIEYAGRINLYVRNNADSEVTIESIAFDGQAVGPVKTTDKTFIEPGVRESYIEVNNDAIAWYRAYPNPVPAGGIAEIVLRLTPESPEEPWNVSVALSDGLTVQATIPGSEPLAWWEYVGIGPDLQTLHMYARQNVFSSQFVEAIKIDGKRVDAHFNRLHHGYRYAKVTLEEPWQKGSFHTVSFFHNDTVAVMVRALPTPPPVAIMGNLHPAEAEQYAGHLFDAHIAFTPGKAATYERLAEYGLVGAYIYRKYLKPDAEKKKEPVYYDDPAAIEHARGRDSLWAYFLEDEPDGRYHRTDLPRWSISRDVQRVNQFCRIFDPQTPTYLQIDHGGYPRNLYIYSQIPDYVCTHAYPLGGDIIGRTLDHCQHMHAAAHPKPFLYLNQGYCTPRDGQREFSPLEMRLEVFTALAAGAKSLQWYPAHGSRGLLKHPVMWNAVGETNGELHQLLPLLSIGTPIGEPLVNDDNILARTILCGDRALVVILVNENFTSTPEDFTIEPVDGASVRVRLPRGFRASGVALPAFPERPQGIDSEINASTVSFDLSFAAAQAAVIYSDASVVAEMQQIHDQCMSRYEPMPEG